MKNVLLSLFVLTLRFVSEAQLPVINNEFPTSEVADPTLHGNGSKSLLAYGRHFYDTSFTSMPYDSVRYERDASERVTKKSYYDYIDSLNSYVPRRSQLYTYTPTGQIETYIDSNVANPIFSLKYIHYYNSNGKLTLTDIYPVDPSTNQFFHKWRDLISYTPTGKINAVLKQSLGLAWVDIQRTLYLYDVNDSCIISEQQKWNFTTQAWENGEFRFSCFYTLSGKLDYTITQVNNPATMNWRNYVKHDYTMNSLNQPLTDILSFWDTLTTAWNYHSMENSTYGSNNRKSSENFAFWQTSLNTFFQTEKTDYFYADTNRLVKVIRYDMNFDSSYVYNYIYDAEKYLKTIEGLEWNPSTLNWDPNYKQNFWYVSQFALPVHWLNLEVNKIAKGHVDILWEVSNQMNCKGYEIQRQLEGESQFTSIGYLPNTSASVYSSYQFIDTTYPNVKAFYRIKQVDEDETSSYSMIRVILPDPKHQSQIEVWPNPASGVVHVRIADAKQGEYVLLTNCSGITVAKSAIAANQIIQLNNLQSGVYWLRVAGSTTPPVKLLVE